MGYWNSTAEGGSLQSEDTGIIWGDQPADIMDLAIAKIVETFELEVGRPPTKTEMRAGLEFSMGIYKDEAVGVDD